MTIIEWSISGRKVTSTPKITTTHFYEFLRILKPPLTNSRTMSLRLLFSVFSSTTRRSIAWNFSFFFCLYFLEASLFLCLFVCWRTRVGDTFGSRGSSGPGKHSQSSSCKHSHINNALQKKIIVVNHTCILCSDKNRTPKEFSKSARKSLEIPCHRISQQKLVSVVFAP